ncbi:MatE [Bifidobacterium hapali]|uniref:MatE n=1 Tax=Bifidobacterium hapali TaxID=1630172 RepID=A0A261FWT0_9BIFI|nr:MATE family efflux transporter [Bifidobacterium hapali]OZG63640.1 MatE [Bifidobacterium hapali]
MSKGLILNIVSNLVFFISGYLIHYYLGGHTSAAAYGVVGTIITVLDFEYMFTSNGARQSLSRNISSGRYNVVDVIVKTLAVQACIVAVFFAINFLGAPLFGRLFNDTSLDLYFKLAAFLPISNGLYVMMLGINDGLQRFQYSAFLSTFYPIIKLGVIPLIMFVFPHDPVMGVEVGYFSAMVIAILLGAALLVPVWCSLKVTGTERVSFRETAHGVLSFSFFFIMASLVLSADTLVVKSVVEPASMAGYYTGAMNFGKTTYYLLQAFAVIILPVVSGLIAKGDVREAGRKAQTLVLVAFGFIFPMAVVISATSRDLLAAFYKPEFTIAAPALSCLALSSFFMGMTVVFNMVLNAEKDTRFSDVLSIVSLVLVVPIFVVSARFGGITAIAAASTICTFVTMTVSYVEVRRRMMDVMTVKTWAVIGINAVVWVVLTLVGRVVSTDNFLLLALAYALVYFAYIGVLFLLRIVSVEQLKAMKG